MIQSLNSIKSVSMSDLVSIPILSASILLFMSFSATYPQEIPTGVVGGVVAISLPEDTRYVKFNEKNQLVVDGTAIVGIPLDIEPASYELEVVQASNETVKLPFRIVDKEYEEQHITIENQEQVTPPPEYYERLTREADLMRTAYATRSPSNPNLLPITLPTKGIKTGVFGTKRFFNGEARNPHSGVDYAADKGTPILSPAPGTVVLTEDMFFNGKTVVIDHGMGLVSVLCHMDTILVETNEVVKRGEQVGTVGSTGRSTGPHLHWTIALQGVKVDPEVFMSVVNAIHETKVENEKGDN